MAERWRPAALKDVVGNSKAVRDLRRWAAGWQSPDGTPPPRRAALLEGPPGVGKTTCAIALARDLGWSVVEMNASDARNQDSIQQIAGRASISNTLGESGTYRSVREGARTLILLDEADCLSGRAAEESSRRAPPSSLRDFLRTRYGSIEALNSAWGLGASKAPAAFAGWEAVPASAGRAAWVRLAAAQRDIADWKGAGRPADLTDRGGLGAIARLVKSSRQPLVLTVNDPQPLMRYSPVFRQGVTRIRFDPVSPDELRPALQQIISREGISLAPALLERIVVRSQGDVRAAITDLEAVSVAPDVASAQSLLGGRDLASDFYAVTGEVLANPRFYRSVELRDRLDATPDDLFPWFEENFPRAAPSALARYNGFEVAASAELMLARARRWRVFGLWSFAGELMSGGISVAISEEGPARRPDLAFPTFLGDMGRSKFQRALRMSVGFKGGRAFHHSKRKAVETTLAFLDRLFRPSTTNDAVKSLRKAIALELELTPEEIGFLLGVEPDSEAVRQIAGGPPTAETDEPPTAIEPPPAAPPAPAPGKRVQKKLAEF